MEDYSYYWYLDNITHHIGADSSTKFLCNKERQNAELKYGCHMGFLDGTEAECPKCKILFNTVKKLIGSEKDLLD